MANEAAETKDFRGRWPELTRVFLKLGTMSYGGSAMLGVMQADIQEKRGWLSKERFLEGWALVNLLPGASMLQFCVFVGYARAGWLGGILCGLCFVVPAFFIMLGLTLLYDAYGALPLAKQVFYGVGPVVLAFLAVAIYRLGKTALKGWPEIVIAGAAAALVAFTPLGIVPAMLLGGCAGVALFGSRMRGALAAAAVLAVVALLHSGWLPAWNAEAAVNTAASAPGQPSLWDVTAFFFKVGALTFGGGYTMLAFVQHQVVNQLQWLTAREFLNGLALGQITPGPILMVAAYVGYKVGGLAGAALAATTIFLPAFLWMLAVLPILDLFKHWAWVKQSMRGISAAVIGLIAVALVQLTPSAVPDIPAGVIGLATVALLLWRPIGPLPLLVAGGVLGVLRMTLLAGL